jgi:CBS domain-containing protein
MTTRIVAVIAGTPVSTALDLMASTGVHHLPVLDESGCCGVLHEEDVIRHLAASPTCPVDRAATPVDRLTRPAVTLPVSARRSDAAHRMTVDGSDAVLVTGRHGLIGIVTATDLIRSLAAEAQPRWDEGRA